MRGMKMIKCDSGKGRHHGMMSQWNFAYPGLDGKVATMCRYSRAVDKAGREIYNCNY
jgi:hypothetical protein